jgi:hypothetical protein
MEVVAFAVRDGTIRTANVHCSDLTLLLERQGRMKRLRLEQCKLRVGQHRDIGRQRLMAFPKLRRGKRLETYRYYRPLPHPHGFAPADLRFDLVEKFHARTIGREIALDLGIPLAAISLSKPAQEGYLLLTGKRLNSVLDLPKVHIRIVPVCALKERIMRLRPGAGHPKSELRTTRQLGLANRRGGPDGAQSGVEFAV